MGLKRNTEGTSQALKIDAFTRIHHLTVSRISKGLIPVCDYVTLIMEWDAGIQKKNNNNRYTFGRNEGNHNTLLLLPTVISNYGINNYGGFVFVFNRMGRNYLHGRDEKKLLKGYGTTDAKR